MKISKNLLVMAASLLLIGAGCTKSNVSTNTNEALVIPDTGTSTETSTDTETKTEDEKKVDDTMDASAWQTYTNAALGFSFNWPDKGIYAPQWEVTFSKAGDASVKDGCFVAEGKTEKTTANGNSFCHTSVAVKDDTAKDYFVTEVGGQNVVLVFTKKASTAKDFTWEKYQEELGRVVASFSVKK